MICDVVNGDLAIIESKITNHKRANQESQS